MHHHIFVGFAKYHIIKCTCETRKVLFYTNLMFLMMICTKAVYVPVTKTRVLLTKKIMNMKRKFRLPPILSSATLAATAITRVLSVWARSPQSVRCKTFAKLSCWETKTISWHINVRLTRRRLISFFPFLPKWFLPRQNCCNVQSSAFECKLTFQKFYLGLVSVTQSHVKW